jgi:leader peptidase (prepilin peptidase)/N-methyltransferase
MNVLLLVLAPLIGWLAGVLANWAADVLPGWRQLPPADRMPHWPGVWRHHATLPWYFQRRGICPHCDQRRTRRAPIVEAVLALLFFVLAARLGLTPSLVIGWIYAWFLVSVFVIDLETRRVLNIMLLPAALFALGVSVWRGQPSLPSVLVGGLVAFGLFWGLFIIGRMMFGRGTLGFGDVKLAGVIGLMVGYPDVLRALVVGALLGAAAAAVLLATHRATLKSTSAYAPYLALGAMVALWGVLGL